MDRDDWAIELRAPPGGLMALRARLDAPKRPRWGRLVATAAVAALLLWITVPRSQPPELLWSADPAFRAAVGSAPHGVRVAPAAQSRLALQQVPVNADGVVMVRLAGTR